MTVLTWPRPPQNPTKKGKLSTIKSQNLVKTQLDHPEFRLFLPYTYIRALFLLLGTCPVVVDVLEP